ncbi:MAG: SEC-C metal-binding domain-containing protein [Eubacteriales bacterium]|nr:SEC-C metal-binding domain-containing protein [Eubacteriales bacterium]
MSLYEEWDKLLNGQTKETFEAFWKEYSEAEMKIYTEILNHKDEKLTGTLKELAEKFGIREVIFEGFVDGAVSSLNDESAIDPKTVTEETPLSFDFDYRKLYRNMLKADASHLYSLEAWDNVLSEDERSTITREFKKSKIYHAPKKIGRNDPCPCGSGKKYKNCCGKKTA